MASKSNPVPFTTTQIKFMVGKEATGKSVTLNNSQVVVIADADGLENADVIVLTGAIEGIYMVKVSGTSAEVLGLDLSDYSAPQAVQYVKAIMSPFCDATSLTWDGGSKTYTSIQANCDDYPVEVGTLEPGTISMEMNYDPDNGIQQYLEDLMVSDEGIFFQIKPKKANTLKGCMVSVATFNFNGAVKDYYKGSISLKQRSLAQRLEIK